MKYSKEETQAKAVFLLKLKADNDIRYVEFCLRLMSRTNVPMNVVEAKIIAYSKGEI